MRSKGAFVFLEFSSQIHGLIHRGQNDTHYETGADNKTPNIATWKQCKTSQLQAAYIPTRANTVLTKY